ncbi:MAG: hypothetical protein H7Y38_12525 [Armatimonadetes bacterium]|nr:hypothetical protein [Armatimonadota bacterium]
MSDTRLQTPRYGACAIGYKERFFVLGGSGANGLLGDAEGMNARTGNVAVMPWKLLPRRYHGAAVVGDFAYIVGGQASGGAGNTLERLDLRTGTVETGRPLPTPRTNAAVVADAGLVWVVGGNSNGLYSGATEVYDPKRDTWNTAEPMPTPRECAAGVQAGLIHVPGGYAGEGGLTVYEAYSLGQGRWFKKPDLPSPLSSHHIAVVGNFLYTFGDYANLGSTLACEVGRGERWNAPRLGKTFVPRRHAAVASIGDLVLVAGGNTAGVNSHLDVVQVFRVAG